MCSALLALCVPFSAGAQEPVRDATLGPRVEPVRAWSAELLDPAGLTRFHLTTRATFSDGDSVFSDSSAAAYEARAFFRFTPGISASIVAPVGVRTADAGNHAAFGNVGLGFIIGGILSEGPGKLFRLAGGFDAYLPTATLADDGGVAQRYSAVPAIRSYEPMLYVPKLFSMRVRGHVDVTIESFTAELELGLVPGFDLRDEGGALLLFSAAVRGSFQLGAVEPFLEIANTRQIAGDGAISPPLLITPGVRFHIADIFDPAIFFSLNFEEPAAVIFGLDLATVLRPQSKAKRQEKADHDDFLDF